MYETHLIYWRAKNERKQDEFFNVYFWTSLTSRVHFLFRLKESSAKKKNLIKLLLASQVKKCSIFVKREIFKAPFKASLLGVLLLTSLWKCIAKSNYVQWKLKLSGASWKLSTKLFSKTLSWWKLNKIVKSNFILKAFWLWSENFDAVKLRVHYEVKINFAKTSENDLKHISSA